MQALVIETEVFAMGAKWLEDQGAADEVALCQWLRPEDMPNSDATNFWACNEATWSSWIKSAGFSSLTEIYRLAGASRLTDRSIFVALKPSASLTARDFVEFSD